MSAAPVDLAIRSKRRPPARRPAPRTVDVTIHGGDFDGWSCTARADFPARVLADLQSGQVDRMMAALDAIVTDHNLPDADGQLATTMADVDPFSGVVQLAGELFTAIKLLPPR